MDKQNRKLKVLVCAYACEPDKGSEPGVGWYWVTQIAKFAEVWVITRKNNRKIIEEELDKKPLPGLHFVYVELPQWMRFWKKGQRGIHLYYYLWLIWAYQIAKKLSNTIHFDLAHHLTFGVYSSPSFLALLPIPFIWGPIGGVDTVPKLLRVSLGIRGRVYEWIHDIGHKLKFLFDPFVRLTMKKSSFIICRTIQTLEHVIGSRNADNVKVIVESGFIPSNVYVQYNRNTYFSVFSSGRLIALKGYTLGIPAFARFYHETHTDTIFEIAGKGYEMKRLRATARKFGVADKVKFLGEIPRRDVIEKLANCDVFMHPSLREGGSWSLMEALSIGKPIICLDYSGPGEMVTEECGIKVRPITVRQTTRGLADALGRLANNPDLRRKMGEAARKRAEEEYTWDKKGEFIKSLYESVLSNESTPCT